MRRTYFITMFLALCVYLAGELRVQTGTVAYTLIALLFIVVIGFLTHVAQNTGVAMGFESHTNLLLGQLTTYTEHIGISPQASIYVADHHLRPAKSVYHALLDGQFALIIEAEESSNGKIE